MLSKITRMSGILLLVGGVLVSIGANLLGLGYVWPGYAL